jgi:hypothetical protein
MSGYIAVRSLSFRELRVVVTMHVKCRCGQAEHETYQFEMPAAESDPEEEHVPGTCPECRAPIRVYLRRAKVLQ